MNDADRCLERLASKAIAQIDQLLDAHVARIRREEPEYRAVPLDELRDDARALMLSALASVPGSVPPDAALARKTARRRAEQRVPLGPLLHAFRMGATAIWSSLLAVAETEGTDAQLHLLREAHRVWVVVDVYATEATTAYQQGLVALAEREAQRRLHAINTLLEGRGADWAELAGTPALIGLPTEERYVAVTAELLMTRQESATSLEDLLRRAGFPNALMNRSGQWLGLVAVPRTASVDGLLARLRSEWPGRTGVSEPFDDLVETASALRDARAAARCLPAGRPGAARYNDDRLGLLLTQSPELGRTTAEAFLGRLTHEADSELLVQTLVALFETGSVAGAADRLFCHRNTVSRRLRRVEQLTGRRLDSARGAAELYIAVHASRLLT